VKAIDKIQEIVSHDALTDIIGTITTIFQGQAMDLWWTANTTVPSIQEYLLMVNDSKMSWFSLMGHELTCDYSRDRCAVQVIT
jgi:hypothetical protein